MKTSPFSFWRLWICILICGALASFFAWRELPRWQFEVWFLDVGQGDSVLIQSSFGHQILIDGGDGERVLEELAEVMPFFDRSLDMLVLTHPHEDHVGGLVAVLENYQVDNVLLTGVNSQSGSYNQFLEEVIKKDIPFFIAEQLVDFKFGDLVLDVLYPFDGLLLEDVENLNNSSIVIMLKYRDQRILLTGDMEQEVEEELLAHHVDLRADVLKVGHHGSKTSSTLSFLAKVRPKKAVIQVGNSNSYGHPNEITLRNLRAVGAEVYRTDLLGRVSNSLLWADNVSTE